MKFLVFVLYLQYKGHKKKSLGGKNKEAHKGVPLCLLILPFDVRNLGLNQFQIAWIPPYKIFSIQTEEMNMSVGHICAV